MPKLTITITDEAHPILKEWANENNYITCLFDKIADLDVYLPIEIAHTITKPVTKIKKIREAWRLLLFFVFCFLFFV